MAKKTYTAEAQWLKQISEEVDDILFELTAKTAEMVEFVGHMEELGPYKPILDKMGRAKRLLESAIEDMEDTSYTLSGKKRPWWHVW